MMPRLTEADVDRLAGQTPCICGSIESWHQKCYAAYKNATEDQIAAAYKRAYSIARRALRDKFAEQALAAISKAGAAL